MPRVLSCLDVQERCLLVPLAKTPGRRVGIGVSRADQRGRYKQDACSSEKVPWTLSGSDVGLGFRGWTLAEPRKPKWIARRLVSEEPVRLLAVTPCRFHEAVTPDDETRTNEGRVMMLMTSSGKRKGDCTDIA